ncbi:MAG TPA: hypothetical protein PLO62_00295 [Candidatus Hydrogenedentes bacterium]|nr:hypothetical protein [Candidatus Hydrogenedentota bacterium]HOS02310.1 hypothetical protein [Candidatus Hydrogenedentota bacterium]
MEAESRYSARRLFGAALLFIVAAPVFWTGVAPPPDRGMTPHEQADLRHVAYPALQYGFEQLRAGHVPLWNPRQLCGAPFLADPRVGLFQPLNWVFLFVSPERAAPLNALLSLVLMGTATTLFVRSLGVQYTSSFLAGVAYAFSGAAVSGMCLPSVAAALAWGPVLVWAASEFRRNPGKGQTLGVGVSGGLLLLSGATAAATMFLALAALFLFLATMRPPVITGNRMHRRDALIGIGLSLGIMLTLTAIQWLPALFWLSQLDQPARALWGSVGQAETPHRLRDLPLQMLAPRPGIVPRLAYLGVIPLLLAPAAALHRRYWRESALLCGFLIVLTTAGATVERLPLGFPREALAFPAVFCFTVLAGIGADRLLTPWQDFRSEPVWKPAIVTLLLALVLFVAAGGDIRGRVFACVLALLPFLLFRTRWSSAFSGMLLALFLYADLWEAGRVTGARPFDAAAVAYERHQQSIAALQEQSFGGRAMLLTHALPEQVGLLYGISAANGDVGAMTPRQRKWRDTLFAGQDARDGDGEKRTANLLHAMSVRALMEDSGAHGHAERLLARGARLREAPQTGTLRVFQNEDALPRAYWTPAWRIAPEESALDTLMQPDFNLAAECVVDRRMAGSLPDSPAPPQTPPPFSCVIDETTPERITVRVDVPQSGIIVLTDTRAPGWTATLDGRPASILDVNVLFRGVYTPEGPHVLQFLYRPLPFMLGSVISAIALVIVAFAGLVLSLRRLTDTGDTWTL